MTAEPGFVRRTRASYDAIARDYAEHFRDELASKPLDRALLATFAELVQTTGGGRVVDIGCGTGRVTAHLHDLGLDVAGIDLSPGMVGAARRLHPHLTFGTGSMTDLDLPDRSVTGLLAYYSIIHIPDDLLPRVLAGFARVLAPGGQVLLAFQTGDDLLHLTEALGHGVALDFHRHRPERVAELLDEAGLRVHARTVREPEEGRERTAQAYLLARRDHRPGAPR
jgi:ubiquinone/menaquinone biosynthesis C-methylase UbiE